MEKGRLAALVLVLILAIAPLVQGLTHPIALASAGQSHIHDLTHDHAHMAAHSHGGQSAFDHDHIAAVILPQSKQPQIWPQACPRTAHTAREALSMAEALRRPPRWV